MSPEWLGAILGGLSLLAAIAAGIYNRGRQEQRALELGAELRRDVNGLGRKNAGMIAFQLRAIAREDTISREKLLDLADLIAPK